MRSFAIALLTMVHASVLLAATAQPDIVYLNRCTGGCSVHPGTDNAITGTSSVVSGNSSLAAFPGTDAVFDATTACVRHTLLPFNIHVIANNPGTAARREIMISTSATQVGQSSNLPGLAPFDGNAHDNTIAFVFSSAISTTNPEPLCHVAAQQVAILYGLEDVVGNCSDIMDFSTGCGEKSFLDQASTCDGTFSGTPGHCVGGATTQNSYAKILATAAATAFLFVNSFEGFEVPRAGPSP